MLTAALAAFPTPPLPAAREAKLATREQGRLPEQSVKLPPRGVLLHRQPGRLPGFSV